jgi:hypothetical protein
LNNDISFAIGSYAKAIVKLDLHRFLAKVVTVEAGSGMEAGTKVLRNLIADAKTAAGIVVQHKLLGSNRGLGIAIQRDKDPILANERRSGKVGGKKYRN